MKGNTEDLKDSCRWEGSQRFPKNRVMILHKRLIPPLPREGGRSLRIRGVVWNRRLVSRR